VPADIHPRLLRAFVAVAEELHFGRAAARIPLAQQAVSRDIQSLERQLGLSLFDRSTRRVELTPAGERLLPRAVRLLDLHDEIARGDTARPLLVDLSSPGLTGPDLTANRILALARDNAPEAELLARFHGGLAAGAAEILARRLDVSFGRFSGLTDRIREQLHHVPLRLEAMAVILAEDHPLAARRAVPLRELGGCRIDICAGNPATTEWSDLGSRLLAEHGLTAAPPYPPPVGVDEMAHYVDRHRDPVLTRHPHHRDQAADPTGPTQSGQPGAPPRPAASRAGGAARRRPRAERPRGLAAPPDGQLAAPGGRGTAHPAVSRPRCPTTPRRTGRLAAGLRRPARSRGALP